MTSGKRWLKKLLTPLIEGRNRPEFSHETRLASSYYDEELVAQQTEAGRHREMIGGMWDEIGRLQFDLLVARGLRPHHRLIDVGCGSLRGGVYFARYLDSGNYYGIDLNRMLIDAGYEKELKPQGLDKRVPRENLLDNNEFDFSLFDQQFDYALALSVFTHLPLNTIRICLERLAPQMAPGGAFYATVFEADPSKPTWKAVTHQPGDIVTYGDSDPYHCRREDMDYLADASGWTAEWIGNFDHPRDQQIVCFRLA